MCCWYVVPTLGTLKRNLTDLEQNYVEFWEFKLRQKAASQWVFTKGLFITSFSSVLHINNKYSLQKLNHIWRELHWLGTTWLLTRCQNVLVLRALTYVVGEAVYCEKHEGVAASFDNTTFVSSPELSIRTHWAGITQFHPRVWRQYLLLICWVVILFSPVASYVLVTYDISQTWSKRGFRY